MGQFEAKKGIFKPKWGLKEGFPFAYRGGPKAYRSGAKISRGSDYHTICTSNWASAYVLAKS